MRSLMILSTLLLSTEAFAEMSAWRDPETDYTHYEDRHLGRVRIHEITLGRGGSAHSRAKRFPEAELSGAIRWNQAVLTQRFQTLRDTKFIPSENGEARAPSWQYPDDGCFARAAMANRTAFHHFYPVPSKVFAFGNLRVKTANSPRGQVSWWYHVAPIVESGGKKYVLDPAIEFARPLELSEWLSAMGDPAKIKVTICSSGTYSPGDRCDKETDGLELRALQTQKHYLRLEAKRLKILGRTP